MFQELYLKEVGQLEQLATAAGKPLPATVKKVVMDKIGAIAGKFHGHPILSVFDDSATRSGILNVPPTMHNVATVAKSVLDAVNFLLPEKDSAYVDFRKHYINLMGLQKSGRCASSCRGHREVLCK